MPESPLFHLVLGQALQAKDDYAAALAQYQSAFAMYDANRGSDDESNRSFALHGMAQCYTSLDSISQAFAVYDQILSENDNDPVALNNYAYRLAIAGQQLGRAEKMSMKSLNSKPLNPTYLDTYAYVLLKEGKMAEALFVMERCMEQYGDEASAEVLDHYADILIGNGHKDKAIEVLKSALAKDPDNQDLKQKLSNVESVHE